MKHAWHSVFLLALDSFWPPHGLALNSYRIGAQVADDPFIPVFEGFREKMAEMGYQEGRDVSYEFYNGHGDRASLEQIALKLIRSRPHLIVTSFTTATAPMARAIGLAVPQEILLRADEVIE